MSINVKLIFRPVLGLAMMACTTGMGGQPDSEPLMPENAKELFSAVNGKIGTAELDGIPVIRWSVNAGQTSRLELRTDNPLFLRLRYYDRFEFEFRVVSGEISNMDMQALGHVSGAYQSKVHEWHLAVHGQAQQDWRSRQLDLARPAWYPWDNPDGDGGGFFRLSALALVPDTVIELRGLRFSRAILRLKPDFELPVTWPVLTRNADGSANYTVEYMIYNAAGQPVEVEGAVVSGHKRFEVSLKNANAAAGAPPGAKVALKSNQVGTFELTAKIKADDIKATDELYEEALELTFSIVGDNDSTCRWKGFLVRPLSTELHRQVVIPQHDLEIIRSKIAAGDTNMRTLSGIENVLKSADGFLAKKLMHIPFDYSHPGSLQAGDWAVGESMPEIVNTKTGEREFGTFHAAYIWKQYLGYGGALENLGKAYLYTQDEKYAAKALELFALYAQQYKEQPWGSGYGMPWDRSPVGLATSRVAGASTYGSNWYFKGHCKLLSMTADSPAWTKEKRSDVYLNFVLPYATEIMKFPGGINNMTNITNHNLLLLGLVFDDATMVRWATSTDAGIISRLGDIDDDGFSSEGRPLNYHFAGMAEYLPAIASLDNSGLKIKYPREKLLAAFRMPFKRAALNGRVPGSGDCGRGQGIGPNGLADQFTAIFPEEDWLYGAGASPLTCSLAGKTPQPNEWQKLLSAEPILFKQAGLAILRSGTTADTQVMATLDYGRNIMHAALDRNQITLIAFGKVFTQGPGSLYNVGTGGITLSSDPHLNSFASHGTLGQNVVLVDQQDQLPAVGQLVAWRAEPDMQIAVSRVDGIAPGVSHIRAMVLVKGVLVVLDRMISEKEHNYDFTYHNFGEMALGDAWKAVQVTAPLATTANYDNIISLNKLQGSGDLRLEWDLTNQIPLQDKSKPVATAPPTAKLSLWQCNSDGGEMYTGTTGLNNPNNGNSPDRAPSLFHRIRGKTANFATVLEPHKGQSSIRAVRFPSASSAVISWGDDSETVIALDKLLDKEK